MKTLFVFTDESGTLDFPVDTQTGHLFTFGSVALGHCEVGDNILSLRRLLAIEDHQIPTFHAVDDSWPIRKRFFSEIQKHNFSAYATIFDKAGAYAPLREDPLHFYKTTLMLHYKYVLPRITQAGDQLLVVVSSLLIGRKKDLVKEAIQDIVSQATPTPKVKTAFWPAQSDPCLQVADYITWAVHRKHSTGKEDAYTYIKDRLKSETLLFAQRK